MSVDTPPLLFPISCIYFLMTVRQLELNNWVTRPGNLGASSTTEAHDNLDLI